jgi:hypothetical protein
MSRRIFVFGSNLAGIHGAGSAKEAFEKHGAVWGCGFGLSGNSFAIPTKGFNLEVLSLMDIETYICAFIYFAGTLPELEFDVVDIGCGLAGYKPEEIAEIFSNYDLRSDKTFRTNINFLGKLRDLV